MIGAIAVGLAGAAKKALSDPATKKAVGEAIKKGGRIFIGSGPRHPGGPGGIIR